MGVGILLVLMASVFSGAGSVLEAQGAQRAGQGLADDDIGFSRLVRQPRYVIGLVIDVLGFLAAAVAMQYRPGAAGRRGERCARHRLFRRCP
jgi:hypothetical protein